MFEHLQGKFGTLHRGPWTSMFLWLQPDSYAGVESMWSIRSRNANFIFNDFWLLLSKLKELAKFNQILSHFLYLFERYITPLKIENKLNDVPYFSVCFCGNGGNWRFQIQMRLPVCVRIRVFSQIKKLTLNRAQWRCLRTYLGLNV